jgi:UDP-N-acetylmuramyl tripeptide synthase
MTESWKGYEGLNLRHAFASLMGKLAAAVVRRTGRGGGTAAPGLVAERLSPAYLYDLLAEIPGGHALISGTNGKTTSAAMVGAMLEKDGREVVRNRSGSNLTRGLLSELLGTTDWRGRLRANAETAGVFEVDEAALVRILPRTRPRAVLLTNLFRDQLDRYGELDTITRRWQAAIGGSDGSFTLIANADDPAVVHAAGSHRGETIFFGVEDASGSEPDDWADATMCPICGTGLSYDRANYSHLGDYRCEGCGFARPQPRIVARKLESDGLTATEFEVESDDETISVRLPLPGTYNVYNAVGAMALAGVMGVGGEVMRRALEEFAPAFGRAERVQVGERVVTMLLVKNPAGANEVIRSLAGLEGEQDFLVLLNDRVADGEDVSWIWDVDFSRLRPGSLVVGGRRASDMALRLKYAGLEPAEGIVTETNFEKALEGALATGEGPLYVLSTYTALLEFRSLLVRKGAVREFWRE